MLNNSDVLDLLEQKIEAGLKVKRLRASERLSGNPAAICFVYERRPPENSSHVAGIQACCMALVAPSF